MLCVSDMTSNRVSIVMKSCTYPIKFSTGLMKSIGSDISKSTMRTMLSCFPGVLGCCYIYLPASLL